MHDIFTHICVIICVGKVLIIGMLVARHDIWLNMKEGMKEQDLEQKIPRKADFVGIWHRLEMERHQMKPIGLILKFQLSVQGRHRPNLGRRRP